MKSIQIVSESHRVSQFSCKGFVHKIMGSNALIIQYNFYTTILRSILKFRENAINLLFELPKVISKITIKTKIKKTRLKSDL